MKVYKLEKSIAIEDENGSVYLVEGRDWDEFINDDRLYDKLKETVSSLKPVNDARALLNGPLPAPIGTQELWACGVTYLRSKVGRQEESKDAGGGDFYARVYEAPRPEVFFKATANRVVGPQGTVRIRKDSKWDVPEPELTLVASSSGKIIGYTVGNDMSSRSIEGENPLYLPQAKMYDGAAAVGPCIYVGKEPIPPSTQITLVIERGGKVAFEGNIAIDQMKRKHDELVSYIFKETTFPTGCYIMTGTGIVPSSDFTLQKGDVIKITIDHIGTLVNTVDR